MGQLARLARGVAYPAVAKVSTQLAEALSIYIRNDKEGGLYIPHYWALYVHDGRGPFGPRRAKVKYLCWFRDPKLDPRLDNGRSPQRYKDVKRLNREQFYFWLAKNREAQRAGMPVPMIVTRFYPFPTYPKRFFDNDVGGGMVAFPQKAKRLIEGEFNKHVLDELRDVLNIQGKVRIQL